VSEADDSCRIDVWLWRARFFKTRNLAARMVAQGCVRLSRGGARIRLDKPGLHVRCGDGLVVTVGDRQVALLVEALGTRRGPAPEARALYRIMEDSARGAPGPN
jgi:ribosome-associated heat shock protein Hsp15